MKLTFNLKRCTMLLLLSLGYLSLAAGSARAYPYGAGPYGICAYGGTCTISLSTAGTLTLPLTPTASSVYTIQSDGVTVTTNNPTGYSLTLASSSSTSAALAKGADTIPASSGTATSPLALAINTWGYRVDGQAGFGTGPTSAVTNASSSSFTFAGVSLSGNPQQIYSSAAAASSGNSIDVWYGLRADNSAVDGAYSHTVVYTATATP